MNEQTNAEGSEDQLPPMRSEEEILKAQEKFYDLVWYDRHRQLKLKIEEGSEDVDGDVWTGAEAAARRVEARYSERELGPRSDFEWGMINGKLSALRWVLGYEWDFLDT